MVRSNKWIIGFLTIFKRETKKQMLQNGQGTIQKFM